MSGVNGRIRVILGLFLILFIGGIAFLNVASPDKVFSESENRVLERRPSLSLHALRSGTFTKDYERYVTDQFVGREVWMGIKTDTDRALGKKESNGVYLGADDYLIQAFTAPTESEVENRVAAIQAFHQATSELRMHVMLAPTAASIYRDKLPAYAPIGDEQAVQDQARQGLAREAPEIGYVDVHADLYERREEQLYYRTDHHWTSKGAYYAYRALCEQIGISPQAETAFDIQEVTNDFYGSLYSKSGYRHLRPDRIEIYAPKAGERLKVEYVEEGKIQPSLYELDHLNQKDKYTVFLGGNHSLVRIKTAHANKGKLLVVKDSFANSMIPFLTAHYAEIDIVDLRYYSESLIELTKTRQYDELLLLYNMATFFEDAFIVQIAD